MFFFSFVLLFFFPRENAQEVDPKQLGWKRVKSARRRLRPDNCNADCIFCHHIVGWHFRGREVHGRRRSAAYSSHDWLAQQATGTLPPPKKMIFILTSNRNIFCCCVFPLQRAKLLLPLIALFTPWKAPLSGLSAEVGVATAMCENGASDKREECVEKTKALCFLGCFFF